MDLGLSFCWPKHHNFEHILDLIQRKGPVDNYESGLGESLHPQTKTDYGRSSGQPSTVDIQVCLLALKLYNFNMTIADDLYGTRTRQYPSHPS